MSVYTDFKGPVLTMIARMRSENVECKKIYYHKTSCKIHDVTFKDSSDYELSDVDLMKTTEFTGLLLRIPRVSEVKMVFVRRKVSPRRFGFDKSQLVNITVFFAEHDGA